MAYGLSAATANSALDTAFNGCYAQLHTGSPGAAGTSNISSDTTREAVTWSAASGGTKTMSAQPSWGAWAGTSPEQITALSFWTAASGGTFIGSVLLTAPASAVTGAAVSLGALTVSFPVLAS